MPTIDDVQPAQAPGTNQLHSRALWDPDFWRQLCPSLRVCDPASFQDITLLGIDEAFGNALDQTLLREGYVGLPPQSWGVEMATLANGVQTLVDNGIAPPFAFLYDEYWLLPLKLHHILNRLLGGTYAVLPDFWCWHVDPAKGEAGWKPHRDKGHGALMPDGRPKSVTSWFALSEATTLNGCMYIMPADRDPVYGTERDKEWQTNMNYAGIRALPAQAGGFFIWNQAVLHWGSQTSTRGAAPRISMAFEFQRTDQPAFNQPLLDPLRVLSFEQRLKLIGKQVLQYQHMYPLSAELKQLAESFVQ